jgi:multidrug efflux system outer membrane protein
LGRGKTPATIHTAHPPYPEGAGNGQNLAPGRGGIGRPARERVARIRDTSRRIFSRRGGGRILHGGIGVFLAIFVAGCTVGPNYQKPEPVVPPTWAETPKTGVTTSPMEIVRWWALFHDEQLNSLIDRAVLQNLDLKLAEARIREERALLTIAGSQAYPALDTSGSYTRVHRSENVAGSSSSQGSLSGGSSTEFNLFQAGFDASWEVDVFGGVRRAVEAAGAEVSAAEEDRRDVLVTLLGEVAGTYLNLRGYQRRITTAIENIQTQRNTVDLARGRYEAGLGNLLAVYQAEALLSSTEAVVPALQTAMRQAIHRLGVLLGLEPEALLAELSAVEPIPPPPPEIPIGLPSQLLRRRPDVRSAERQLAAATARIGVATADLFPRFSLLGLLGLQSSSLSDLVSAESRYWSAGPSVLWPVFDAGRIRANIQVQNARQEQALVIYEQTVLQSLEDVENALVAYSKEHATRGSLAKTVDASRRAAEIARELYKKGLVDFLNVLQSESALYQAQDQLTQSEQRLSTALVSLFKALGGGWEILPAEPAGSHKGNAEAPAGRRDGAT